MTTSIPCHRFTAAKRKNLSAGKWNAGNLYVVNGINSNRPNGENDVCVNKPYLRMNFSFSDEAPGTCCIGVAMSICHLAA